MNKEAHHGILISSLYYCVSIRRREAPLSMRRIFSFRFFLFFLSIFALQGGYFFFYYRALSLSFLVALHSSLFWRATVCLLFGGFLLYSLINFGHASVFHAFTASHSQGSIAPAGTLASFVAEYYRLIPLWLYAAAIVLFLFFIFVVFFYTQKTKSGPVFFHGVPVQKKHAVAAFGGIAFLFFLSQAFAFVLIGHFHRFPDSDWWNQIVYMSAKGLPGHMYDMIYSDFFSRDHLYQVAQAKTSESMASPSSSVSFDSDPGLPTTLEKIRADQTQLFHLAAGPIQQSVVPPAFGQPPHILIFQLESIPSWAIEQTPSVMPFLSETIKHGITVSDFYATGCHTIDAEFVGLCGVYPDSREGTTAQETNYSCLPALLKERYGYATRMFHSNISAFWNRDVLAPAWGFDELFFVPYFRDREPDNLVLDDALDRMAASDTPVLSYVMSYTSHTPHEPSMVELFQKAYGLQIRSFDGPVEPSLIEESELDEYALRFYLGFLNPVDTAIAELFDGLKKRNLLDNTIVVIYGDHRYYNFPRPTLENYYRYNRIPFVLSVPGMPEGVVQDIASHIDIAPTLLQLVEGASFDPPETFLGTSLFSERHPNNAVTKCLGGINFINRDGIVHGTVPPYAFTFWYGFRPLDPLVKDAYTETVMRLVNDTDIFWEERQP